MPRYLSMYTLDDKIGQRFAVGFHGLHAPDYLLDWLAQGRVGGVILFGRNVQSPEQLASLTQSIHRAAKYPVLIGIDQEGGTVARLREGFTESPGAMVLAAIGQASEAHTRRVSRILAEEMQALGINWNYSPAVDLSHNARNPAVGTRSFGSDPLRVSRLAAAAVTGFQETGVAACAKHFPGLGNTAVDTHLALPSIETPLDALLACDLLPYRAAVAAQVASIMTTHTIYLALDSIYPATLSPVIIQRLLRQELKFNGVVTTDCMEMKAISAHYGPGESAVLALLAGVDLLLFSHTRAMQEEAFTTILHAAKTGRISEASIDASFARIETMKSRFPAQPSDLSLIRSPDHLMSASEAARLGVVVLSGDLPATFTERDLLVEFVSALETQAVEQGGQTNLGRIFARNAPQVSTLALNSTPDSETLQVALARVSDCETLFLATRNAYLNPEQLEQAQALMRRASRTVHLCLRTPYDSQALPGAAIVLCTCGDSTPSLQAALDALLGRYTPTGCLPAPLTQSDVAD